MGGYLGARIPSQQVQHVDPRSGFRGPQVPDPNKVQTQVVPQPAAAQPQAPAGPAVKPQAMLNVPGQAVNAVNPQIQAAREKFMSGRRDEIGRQTMSNQQATDDALARRFTALGQGTGSGAAIGAMLKGQEMNNAQAQSARNELAGQEMQLAESDAARQFGADQAFQDMNFKKGMFDIEQGNKLSELDLAQRNFELERDAQDFNKQLAAAEAGKQPASGLLGRGSGTKGALLGGAAGYALMGAASPMAIPAAIAGSVLGSSVLGGGDGGGLGCFFTTAAVEVMGLPDDCWVLEKARAFRDGYMAQDLARAKEIREYYVIAPMVVEKINARDDAKRIWKSFFWKDIVPFVEAIEENKLSVAHELYRSLIAKAKELGGM